MSAHHVFTHCLICEQLCGLDVEVEDIVDAVSPADARKILGGTAIEVFNLA